MSDDELRDRVRAADPARDLPAADPARTAALLRDVTATELTDENRATGTRGRSGLTWLVAAAAVVVIAAAGLFAVRALAGDHPRPVAGPGPTATSDASPSGSPTGTIRLSAPAAAAYAARCPAPSAEVLGTADTAFDGTVTALTDDLVTLRVNRWYAGGESDTVEVSAPAGELGRLVTSVDFAPDARYLVSATQGHVRICGLSGPYDPDLAALYAAAFGA